MQGDNRMDENLVVEVELLDYGKALAEIVAEPSNAQLAAVEMCRVLKEEDTYERMYACV